jgi:hypothetical protein
MAREMQLVRQTFSGDDAPQEAALPFEMPVQTHAACDHRAVSKDGRIVCSKIIEGDNEVTPNNCRACPFKAVNCAHLRFSLCQTSPSPLVVRFNGRTEIWDDGPPHLRFERAACTARVIPIHEPRSCAGCTLRQPLQPAAAQLERQRRVAGAGRVVPFPGREVVAAAG